MIVRPSAPCVIAVGGLWFEARIAAGPGVVVVCSPDPQRLGELIADQVKEAAHGIISFGIAGGLSPALRPGDWVVANAVIADGWHFVTDPAWSRRLAAALPGARLGTISGGDLPVTTPPAKAELHARTGALAADTESHVAASIAADHRCPFAACRVICDPAGHALPPAALVRLRPDGRPNVPAILWSLLRHPGQFASLVRVTNDARRARASLLRGRRQLGEALAFPDFV